MCDDSVLVYRRLAKLTNKFVKKILFYFQAQKIRLYIKKYSKLFDKILVISKKDGKILENFYTNEIIDIPNIVFTQGKNINNFKKVKNKNPKILFTGAMQTRANRDAVKYFINEIFPIIETDLNNIEIHFVGSGADLLKINNRKNIFLTGYVDDLSEHYYGSDVYICPLRAGSGIKNKILEAMACGCSIVTSSIGIEGLNVQNGKEVLISDNAKDFAFSVKRLIDDSKLRSYLGINARKFIEKAYDYENTKKKLLQAIFLVR
jgi:glycosyltransferase involved in cell wall biosynthesis